MQSVFHSVVVTVHLLREYLIERQLVVAEKKGKCIIRWFVGERDGSNRDICWKC